jgi:hypothetical protein
LFGNHYILFNAEREIIVNYEEYRLLGFDAVSLVRTDVPGEHVACIMRVERIIELGTSVVTSN